MSILTLGSPRPYAERAGATFGATEPHPHRGALFGANETGAPGVPIAPYVFPPQDVVSTENTTECVDPTSTHRLTDSLLKIKTSNSHINEIKTRLAKNVDKQDAIHEKIMLMKRKLQEMSDQLAEARAETPGARVRYIAQQCTVDFAELEDTVTELVQNIAAAYRTLNEVDSKTDDIASELNDFEITAPNHS
jgi:peroxiredoxin family protein